MKLSRAREIAVVAARHHCELHGLQLLDETVGLRAWRVRRIDGRAHLERGYGFELSVDGDDRATGRLVGGSEQPQAAVEVWTFVRPRGGNWMLSAIQQTN